MAPERSRRDSTGVRIVERRDEWNDVVRAFDHCDARHSWEWGELRARQGWTPLRVAAFGGGECLAAAAFLARGHHGHDDRCRPGADHLQRRATLLVRGGLPRAMSERSTIWQPEERYSRTASSSVGSSR